MEWFNIVPSCQKEDTFGPVGEKLNVYKNNQMIGNSLYCQEISCGISNIRELTWLYILRGESLAKDEYMEAKKQAVILQDNHLNTRKELSGNNQREAIIKIIKNDKGRQEWQQIKRIFGKSRMSPLTEVEAWNGHRWDHFHQRHDVESYIMKENEKCFRLTESSPFMSPNMTSQFGFLVEHSAADLVWKGNYTPQKQLAA